MDWDDIRCIKRDFEVFRRAASYGVASILKFLKNVCKRRPESIENCVSSFFPFF